ncbi:hypothetical protein Rhe02_15560 [Rhizocola hellebori]|uniref:CoA transferase n=1 Tax=Rhizocola hellebori TaxID=1392758 RepID=A0A8J3VDE1_9ACTN|nr:hypothetical protein Rhe02_15560 [Rhizocola hellebori]
MEALVVRHLTYLGAQSKPGESLRIARDGHGLEIAAEWAGLDEPTAQAAYGLMAIHGRAQASGPQRLAVDYVTTATGVIATQGVLAALLSGMRGRPIAAVGTGVANAALLTISQYLAAASASDPDYLEPLASNGTPPPFESADGTLLELETLDPQPWADFWTFLGLTPAVIARAWKAFVLRYATATASLPAELHQATRMLAFEQLRQAAERAGVTIQPVRTFGQRLADVEGQCQQLGRPWTISPRPGRRTSPSQAMDSAEPLSGLLVVETGRRIQGPMAGHILQLLGAEVVRIEPLGGDPLRGMPPMVGDCSARFLALNRNKRVVEADLRAASGRATVRELARDAAVFLHNLAPGKAAQMSLDAPDLWKINPGLVYAYASGWGEERGGSPPPGTDFIAQAYSGLAHNVRPAGQRPAGSLMTILDVLGGLIAAEGVVAALVNRYRTGRGQQVDSSLLSAAGVLQAPIAESAAAHQPVWGMWDAPVPTADGHVMIAAGSRPPQSLSPTDLASQRTVDALASLRSAGMCAVAVCQDPAALVTDPAVSPLVEFDGCAFVRPPWRFVR